MRWFSVAVLAVVLAIWFSPRVTSGKPFPQLLPPASDFELTLREDPNSNLPLGPSCGGEAGLTIYCRAFVVTLKNIGQHTIHLSRIGCQEPMVDIERKEPNSSSGWWTISHVNRPRCTPWTYTNLRLRPGESTEFATRLISPSRPWDVGLALSPGEQTLRAQWWLWGCIEDPEGTDCMAPLQVMRHSGIEGIGSVEFQTPVEVLSNEIKVESPTMPDLGMLKLSFEVNALPNPQGWSQSRPAPTKCAGKAGTSIECTVFHYAIRNLGDRAIRNGRFTCSDYSIMPEYRTDDGEWKRLESRLQICNSNVYFETPILPGKTAEGTFTIPRLAPEFDTEPLYPAGEYHLRFQFQSSACFAAPDGSFCLLWPKEQPAITSNEITVHATEFVSPGKPE
jgi:hypothetical protein